MEEKERYEVISPSLNGYAYIHDLKTDNVLNTYDSCDLLNQQSKRIKELEQENQQLKEAQKQLAIEELKLALDNFRNRPAYFDVARQELCLSEQDKQFIDFINNRIKELGGGENE